MRGARRPACRTTISVNNLRATEIKLMYHVISALKKQLYRMDHCFACMSVQLWGTCTR